ncbi:DUF982 domain-containing protein [Mesorhizobium sp. WSM3860]|uniref:DUF982 domain-containing protein n=1 Tax=Mesorhizobium sp. WSM3860 TaxID=2029403 RepID=UPI000BAF3AB1|nr:DUF982 domain-containing protein [Mesorhizobium sp. WSM3860]PBC01810.1 hypothetical protein CK220_24585 [Mesorhizobium sp. WSM3860]
MGPNVFGEPVGRALVSRRSDNHSHDHGTAEPSARSTDVFAEPVLVDDVPFGVRKIRCAMDAIEFLEEWPFEKRCRLHGLASDACCAAYDGRGPVAAARKVFVSWAIQTGICASAPCLELDAVEAADQVTGSGTS